MSPDRGAQRGGWPAWAGRWGFVLAAFGLLATGATAHAGEPPTLVVVVEHGSDVSAAEVMRAVARELGEKTTTPDDAAPQRTGRLDVRSRHGVVDVTFRDPRGRTLEREVAAPGDRRARVSLIALLAGNLARNEADDLVPRAPAGGGAALLVPALRPESRAGGLIAFGLRPGGRVAPGPPPRAPTAEQAAALEALQEEADAYERGARDYRDTVTTIVQSHYEAKKKLLLAGMDRQIAVEKRELQKARADAIDRLQKFIARYSGPRAVPDATPDAMYELAALYEERARSEDATVDLAAGLGPSIALYDRVIREFPGYRELAGVFYYLGHAYNDAGRVAEAQHVWRSLVCHNHYPYPGGVLALPQDHDLAYWTAWRDAHRDASSSRRGGPDTVYENPYPADCAPVAAGGQRPGDEARYVAEVWWQIGNWEFDLQDLGGGYVEREPAAVYDYNRAASAYLHALESKRAPLYGVALYKYAWTLFKQQRYEAATQELVHLLSYTDEQQRLTGDPGADFRGEAYTYIAGSLTNLDFKGPGPEDPFIPRPDIAETEPRPEVAERKLRVAIDRVQDPALIPQDKPWTIEIYEALATEFRGLGQLHNAVAVYADVLAKWPMDPGAPEVQSSIAQTYDELQLLARPGTPEHDRAANDALEARTLLARYVGNTPWTDANKDNPGALREAERLVRGGLRVAAATHTNGGHALVVAAGEATDARGRVGNLARALAEYRLAALGWDAFLRQDDGAADAYDTRYWLADATHQQIRIGLVLSSLEPDSFPPPKPQEVAEAKAAAIAVRDSDEDDRYLANAAFFVVDETDVERDIEYRRYEESKGLRGVLRRTAVRFDTDEVATRVVITDPVPPAVLASVSAREEYAARVPAKLDQNEHAPAYEWYAAQTFFLYGRFDEAKARLTPIYRDRCGKDEYGYRAWETLLSMSNLARDEAQSAQLAEAAQAHPCCVTPEQCTTEASFVARTNQGVRFTEAGKAFERADRSRAGKDADALWRQAARSYETALEQAPGDDAAPEAAILGARAYKRVGEPGKAIAMYRLFVTAYGSEEILGRLQSADARKYATRLGYLAQAYDDLSTTYYGLFDYPRAAETLAAMSAVARFDETRRKEAARNAMVLYLNIGQRDRAAASYRILAGLHPTPGEKANADFLLAGSSEQTFYAANRGNPAAAKYALLAAYQSFKTKPVDITWARNTVRAWEFFREHAPGASGKSEANGAPFADYGAEAELAVVDDQLKKAYQTGRQVYGGPTEDVIARYERDAKDAQRYDDLLEHVVVTYGSAAGAAAAIARQGALYDALRTGLYYATPPAVRYLTAEQERRLALLERSGRPDLIARAEELRETAKELWRTRKERELAAADELMVRRYATAVALARHYDVRDDHVANALGRLAVLTDLLGEVRMRQYVTGTKDPTDPSRLRTLPYTDGMYAQARPGFTAIPSTTGTTPPAPAAP